MTCFLTNNPPPHFNVSISHVLTSDIAATNRLSLGPSAGPLPGRAPHRFHMLCRPQLSQPVCGTRSVLEHRFLQLVHSKKRSVALIPF